ncbi:type IV pilus assembly protein PilV [Halopseudomonas salegens]|uniref:Type IV pilus assembly protein PilV n=2 Tax=Halopseudomonas salegens TaxID=1434072 RepID=A0A1H2EBE0_9GAMM|nr:type IV pilus assembly protein PilV [Halopseudomonas salegens]
MIEVLIAIVVLAVGALGFAGVQVVAMQKSENANYRSNAMLIAQDAVERMQANSEDIDGDGYLQGAIELDGTPDQTCASSCDIVDLDTQQLAWSANQSLPNGEIMIAECAFNGLNCVVLSWGEQDIDACMTADGINLSDDANCLVMEFGR